MSTHETEMRNSVFANHDSKPIIGFWIYLMTDCVLFASLFAAYAVLVHSTNGGPAGSDIFNLPTVLTETIILLTSSFTCGLAMLATGMQQKAKALIWLALTFALGASFLGIELNEFTHLVRDGFSWHTSGFLSAFFTLVGTHGLHITIGLIWLAVLWSRIFSKGIARVSKKLMLFSLFWHFLDIIWIFIFTIVYMMGAIR